MKKERAALPQLGHQATQLGRGTLGWHGCRPPLKDQHTVVADGLDDDVDRPIVVQPHGAHPPDIGVVKVRLCYEGTCALQLVARELAQAPNR